MDNFGFYKTILDNFLQKNAESHKTEAETDTKPSSDSGVNLLNFLNNQGDESGFSLTKILTSLIESFNSNKKTDIGNADALNDVQDNSFKAKNVADYKDDATTNAIKHKANKQSLIPVSENPLIGAIKSHENFVNRVKKGNPIR